MLNHNGGHFFRHVNMIDWFNWASLTQATQNYVGNYKYLHKIMHYAQDRHKNHTTQPIRLRVLIYNIA